MIIFIMMNITDKVLFQQEDFQQNIIDHKMDFSELLILFIICYMFTRFLHSLVGSYVN